MNDTPPKAPDDVVERVAKAIGDAIYAYVDPNDTPNTWGASLEAARAAIAAMDGWQPIETAPKDGTKILAWFPMLEAWDVAFWFTDQWGVFAWVDQWNNDRFETSDGDLDKPTHWRPLPEPPA